jgi:hypothetical protein
MALISSGEVPQHPPAMLAPEFIRISTSAAIYPGYLGKVVTPLLNLLVAIKGHAG